MLRKAMRFLIMITFVAGGISIGIIFNDMWINGPFNFKWAVLVFVGLFSSLLGYFLAPIIISIILKIIGVLENILNRTPTQDIVSGAGGLIIGLIIANLLALSFNKLPYIGPYFAVGITIVTSYLGWSIGSKKKEEVFGFFSNFKIGKEKNVKSDKNSKLTSKIIDTSVIIDGRIADICKTGFIEGTLIIPKFVLEELQHIADSADALKRNRGRRGLDILNKIRKELDVRVKIVDNDYNDIAEVDSKLVMLTQDLKGKIITNDYNLNKIAELQGVEVLNINELANAIKPVVLPGEEMVVQVIKDGKENEQGIGYLDDGTMIVVEHGRKYINKTITIIVTSVLQTAAGRMIFAKPKNSERCNDNKVIEKKINGQHILEVTAGA